MRRAYSWLPVIFVLGCIGLAFLVAHQATVLARLKSRREDSAHSHRVLMAGLEQKLRWARDGRAAAEKQAALLRQHQPAPAGSVVQDWLKSHTTMVHESDLLRDHPEYAEIMTWQKRRAVMRQYGSGLASLGLTADQLTRLKDLLAERITGTSVAAQAAQAAGLKPNSPEWEAALKPAQDHVDQEISSALGTDGGELVRRLQAQVASQETVLYSYAPVFEDAGEGLTAGQARGLAGALDSANQAAKEPAAATPGDNEPDPATHLSPHDGRILAAAAPVLNADQLGILRTDLAQAQERAAILKQYTGGLTEGYRVVP